MPRPKGSKNKPKVDAKGNPVVKPTKALKKAVATGKTKVPATVAKAVKESKPLPALKKAKQEVKVNKPELEPETPAATGPKTRATAGKNEGEAVIRAVDDDESEGEGNTIVMQGGKPTLRKSSSNPDLD